MIKKKKLNYEIYDEIYLNELSETNEYIAKLKRPSKAFSPQIELSDLHLISIKENQNKLVEPVEKEIELNLNSPKFRKINRCFISEFSKITNPRKKTQGKQDTYPNVTKIQATSFYDYKKGRLFRKEDSNKAKYNRSFTQNPLPINPSGTKITHTYHSHKEGRKKPKTAKSQKVRFMLPGQNIELNAHGDVDVNLKPSTSPVLGRSTTPTHKSILSPTSAEAQRKKDDDVKNVYSIDRMNSIEDKSKQLLKPQSVERRATVMRANFKRKKEPKQFKVAEKVLQDAPKKFERIEVRIESPEKEANKYEFKDLAPERQTDKEQDLKLAKKMHKINSLELDELELDPSKLSEFSITSNKKQTKTIKKQRISKEKEKGEFQNKASFHSANTSFQCLGKIKELPEEETIKTKRLLHRHKKGFSHSKPLQSYSKPNASNSEYYGRLSTPQSSRNSQSMLHNKNPFQLVRNKKPNTERERDIDSREKTAGYQSMRGTHYGSYGNNPNQDKNASNWKMRRIDKILRTCAILKQKAPSVSLDYSLVCEEFRNERFNKTYEILKEIDFAETAALEMMYRYKKKGLTEVEEEMFEVSKDYKAGLGDPDRQVAKLEKQKFSKKKHTKQDRNKIVSMLRGQLNQQ